MNKRNKLFLFFILLVLGLSFSEYALADNLSCTCYVTKEEGQHAPPDIYTWKTAEGVVDINAAPVEKTRSISLANDGNLDLALHKMNECPGEMENKLSNVPGASYFEAHCDLSLCKNDVCNPYAEGLSTLKWETSLGAQDTPVEINHLDVMNIEVKASGSDNIAIKCLNCTEAYVLDGGDGTAQVIWDTKNTIISNELFLITIQASDTTGATNSILGYINTKIVRDCSKTIVETECNAFNECEWSSGQCIKKIATVPVDLPDAPPPMIIELPNFLGTNEPTVIIGRIVNLIVGLVGTIAFLIFIYGGVLWLISSGREAYVDKGKDAMIWSAIGLAVVFASNILVKFVIQVLSANG